MLKHLVFDEFRPKRIPFRLKAFSFYMVFGKKYSYMAIER